MSKIVFVCSRKPCDTSFSQENLELLSKRLEPDNISFHAPKIIEKIGLVIAIFNPNDSIHVHDSSVCLGQMIDAGDEWWKPGSTAPDGSYALFRSDEGYVEILTDVLASRSTWYYFDDEVFIASSSQRAIVHLLRSFSFNRAVIPWVLSAGFLGPCNSWDSRIKFLTGDSSLTLDRSSWTLSLKGQETDFSKAVRSKKEHYEDLLQAISVSVKSLDLDYSKWVLPLSGGYDSRGILCMLKDVEELRCITWGLEESQYKEHNDAFVAKKVADYFGKKHTYHPTDLSDEPVEVLFNRFLICGEGRIDHISAYMDGFSVWKDLFNDGVHGVIRGDEVLGCSTQPTELDVRLLESFPLLSDFANLKDIHEYGIESQELPDWVQRQEGEHLIDWREKMAQILEMPNFLAALNDLKLPYVEVINPLLTKRIVSVIRGLPYDLIEDKILYKRIVNNLGPNISYAKYNAIASPKNILRKKNVVQEIQRELKTEFARSVIPVEFINYVLDKIEAREKDTAPKGPTLKRKIGKKMPRKLKSLLRHTVVKPMMNFHLLAFRCYVLSAMNRILAEDAKALD